MEEKDLKYEELRKRLMDAHMHLALLGSKEGNPLYEEQLAAAKLERANIRRELAKYKSMKKIEEKEREEMKR